MIQLLYAVMIQGTLFTGSEEFNSMAKCEAHAELMRAETIGIGAVCVKIVP